MRMMHSLQHKRGRYGEEPGDVKKLAFSRSLIGGIFKTSRTVHQYKEVSTQFGLCPYSLLVSFSGNIIILEVPQREERY